MATLIGARHSQAIWRDYLELTKPKVVVLMLITSLVGMFLATRAGVPWAVLIFGNLGIALCAGGAAAVNHVVDRRIDAVMARTHKRPLAQGRVSPMAALAFALFLAVAGLALLLAFTNRFLALELVHGWLEGAAGMVVPSGRKLSQPTGLRRAA